MALFVRTAGMITQCMHLLQVVGKAVGYSRLSVACDPYKVVGLVIRRWRPVRCIADISDKRPNLTSGPNLNLDLCDSTSPLHQYIKQDRLAVCKITNAQTRLKNDMNSPFPVSSKTLSMIRALANLLAVFCLPRKTAGRCPRQRP